MSKACDPAAVQESSYMATVSKEVAEAYADCWDYHPKVSAPYFDAPAWRAMEERRNLEFFATRYLSRDEAIRVLEQWVKEYNEFTPAVLKRLPDDAEVRIAREGSVCLYVRLPYGSQSKLPTAKRLKADERDELFLQSSRCVRYWWD